MAPHPLSDERVTRTLSAIDGIKLPHPSSYLLAAYIHGDGAQSLVSDWIYILECITRNGSPPHPPDTAAQCAITRRDGAKCCVTGKKGSIFDPLCILPILPIPDGWIIEKKRVFDMLGAFLGVQNRDWWLEYVKNPRFVTPYGNHWLIKRSAAVAFANGFVYLERQHSSMIEKQYRVSHVHIGLRDPVELKGCLPLLGDHSRLGIRHADPRLIDTHARLCNSFRFLEIARKIAPEILGESELAALTPYSLPSQHEWSIWAVLSTALSAMLPLAVIGNVMLMLWVLIPGHVRIAAYRLLRRVGKNIYGGPKDYSTVQRLPFGLYLKYNGEPAGFRNEFNALQLVRQYTSVPVPRPLDVAVLSSSQAYLLTTRLPGVTLSCAQHELSDMDRQRIVGQMQGHLSQIRSIPNAVNRDAPICNTLGEACRDSRIRNERPVGPFPDEVSFSQMLRFPDEPSRRGHKIVFTHADLNPRNILVDEVTQKDGSTGWTVTGIVDWEFAGYYPEYWDYTKALFEGFRWIKRYNDMVKDIFEEFGDYSKELDVETRSWAMGDGV
ncbi:hypothetical protein O1611_g4739 [Lasiodiplodia mahajangana]|uniref:Uncharacterized protein n=1 Tax=Lasiodiplodia mahajangana TaxID=1108764 RepID=A0ACC2JN57_9PEZI|nr:hypothetical protein O1611_g4739 [Lasiodiplodia mahajangana]